MKRVVLTVGLIFASILSYIAVGQVTTPECVLNSGNVIVIPAWVPHGFEMLEETGWYEVHGPG